MHIYTCLADEVDGEVVGGGRSYSDEPEREPRDPRDRDPVLGAPELLRILHVAMETLFGLRVLCSEKERPTKKNNMRNTFKRYFPKR